MFKISWIKTVYQRFL